MDGFDCAHASVSEVGEGISGVGDTVVSSTIGMSFGDPPSRSVPSHVFVPSVFVVSPVFVPLS